MMIKHTLRTIGALLVAGLASCAWAQSTTSSGSNPFRSARGLGGGLYFSSPAAAYMNTMFMRGSDAQQVAAVKRESAARRARQAAAAGAGSSDGSAANASRVADAPLALSATNFKPVTSERLPAIDSLVAAIPPGAQREQMRTRIHILSDAVEHTPGWQNNNLAQATYVLAGMSLSKVTGVALDTSRTRELLQGINDAYAKDTAFRAMSDAERSHLYYVYVAAIGLTMTLCDSKDANEARQGQALARNTLRVLGIKTQG